MKKWLNLFLIISVFSVAGLLLYFSLDVTQAQSGISITARIESICGDGIIDSGEECDGSNLGGQTCAGISGYTGGTLSCDSCSFDVSGCTTAGPPIGGGGFTIPTKVILQGKAYSYALISALKDGNIVATSQADSSAAFKIEISNLTGGIYTFGLWAEDKVGRKSITFSVTVTVSSGMIVVIGDILIPPTIELTKSQFEKGEFLDISGQAAPQSEVSIYIESSGLEEDIINKVQADQEGDWTFSFNTSLLDNDSYSIKANVLSSEGLVSSFSHALEFVVGKIIVPGLCPKADFNKDGKTNLVDFSILLYWWGKYDVCVDQNKDSIVDLIDFSILMYWWTG